MSVEETAPHRGTIQLLHFVCVFRARGGKDFKAVRRVVVVVVVVVGSWPSSNGQLV